MMRAFAFLFVGCVIACGDTDPIRDIGRIDGDVVPIGGATSPDDATAVVLWATEDGRLYKWGEGTATAATYVVEIGVPPPAGAVLAGGAFGVASIALVPSSSRVPDGVVAEDFLATALGNTGEYGLIYRSDDRAVPPANWLLDFRAGVMCAVCVKDPTGVDTFMSTSCVDVDIQVGPSTAIPLCHWR